MNTYGIKNAAILGGTKGLGKALAMCAIQKGVYPILLGSSAGELILQDKLPHEYSQYQLDLLAVDHFPGEKWTELQADYLFWVSGIFLKQELKQHTDEAIDGMIDVHLRGPIKFLRNYLQHQSRPLHLITIASCSSWRLRQNEALYCGLKAAKAAITRNFAEELHALLPGSKTLLVNPGGLKTENFWKGQQDINTEGFLDPFLTANIIWDHVLQQESIFQEIQILRKKPVVTGSEPILKYGPQLPEVP